MKKITVMVAALMLAGCASAPKPQVGGSHVKSAPAKSGAVSKSAPVEATTPNQIVKKRWYDRFLKHKSK